MDISMTQRELIAIHTLLAAYLEPKPKGLQYEDLPHSTRMALHRSMTKLNNAFDATFTLAGED